MPRRTAKYVSAVLASILAGAPLATISHAQTRAADDCVSAPKEGAPQGSHWYYRVDRATKRHCWYLRQVGDKLPQSRAPSYRSAKSTPPQAEGATQRLIADAHAELPAQTRVEQPNGRDRPMWPTQADAAGTESRRPPAGEARPSVVASRWPESGLSSPLSARPPADNLAANVQQNSTASPVAAVSVAGADSSPQHQSRSIPMLLSAIAAALALAGITAGLVLKFGGARRPRPAKVRVRRGTIWESTDDDTIMLSDRSATDVMPRRSGFARDLDRASDGSGSRRTAGFFSHLSKRTRADRLG
jgi:hypothetical protein